MTAPRELKGPEGWQIKLLVTWGRIEEAQRSLDAYNAVDRAFGGPGYVLPAPIEGPMEGLVACPWDATLAPVERISETRIAA